MIKVRIQKRVLNENREREERIRKLAQLGDLEASGQNYRDLQRRGEEPILRYGSWEGPFLDFMENMYSGIYQSKMEAGRSRRHEETIPAKPFEFGNLEMIYPIRKKLNWSKDVLKRWSYDCFQRAFEKVASESPEVEVKFPRMTSFEDDGEVIWEIATAEDILKIILEIISTEQISNEGRTIGRNLRDKAFRHESKHHMNLWNLFDAAMSYAQGEYYHVVGDVGHVFRLSENEHAWQEERLWHYLSGGK